MNYIEIFINEPVTTKLDIDSELNIALQYSIADIRDISKRNTSYSKTINLPGTKNNNYWFGDLFDINADFTSFNPNKKTPVKLLVNTETVLSGFLQLKNIVKLNNVDQWGNRIRYEVVLYNNAVDLMTELGEKTLYDLDLSEYTHIFRKETVEASWNHTWEDGYVYPIYGEWSKTYQYNLDWFYPNPFYKTVLDRIITESGYGWTGSFKTNPQFEKEIITFVKDGNKYIDEAEVRRRKFRAGIVTDNTVFYNRLIVSFANQGYAILSLTSTTSTNPLAPGGKAPYRFDNDSTPPNFDNEGVYDTTVWQWTVSQTGTYDIKWGVDYDILLYNDKSLQMLVPPALQTAGITGYKIKPEHYLEKSTDGGITWQTIASQNGPVINFGLTINAGATVARNVQTNSETLLVPLIVGTKVRLSIRPVQAEYSTIGVSDPPGSILTGPLISIRYKNSPLNYLLNDAQPSEIGQGSEVDLGVFLPDKLKQKDLISDVIKRYNLYIEVDPDNERLLIFTERPNFYTDADPVLDWTYKKDFSQEDKIALLSDLQFKEMVFTYKLDKDFENDLYNRETGDIYGQFKYSFDNDFVKGVKVIESPFSSTPIVKTEWGAYLSSIDPENPKIQPRVLYWGGLKQAPGAAWELEYIDIDSPNATPLSAWYSQYPYAGHFDDPLQPRLDINFGACKYYRYSEWDFIPSANMYNTYWSDYVRQIENGRLLTCFVSLDEADISFIKNNFNSKIFIKDSYYYINKIIDYKPLQEVPTQVELIKIEDGIRWVNTTNVEDSVGTTSSCPPDMIAKKYRDGWYYVSASGATVSQQCCELLGGTWDGKSCFARPTRPIVIGTAEPIKDIWTNGNSGWGIIDGSKNTVGGSKNNIIEVGTYSYSYTERSRNLVLGDNNDLFGFNLISSGNRNTLEGDSIFIFGGNDNDIKADNVFAFAKSGITQSQSNTAYFGDNFEINLATGDILIGGETFSKGVDGALSGRWELEYTDSSNPSTDAYFVINNPIWASASTIKFNVIAKNGGDYSSYFNYVTSELAGGATMRIQVTNVNDNSNFAIFNTDDGASAFYGYIFNLLTADTIWNGTPSLTDNYAISFQLEPVGGTGGGSYLYYTEPGANQAQIDTLSPSGQIELINGDSAIGLYPTNVAISRGLTSSINIDDTGIQITNEVDLSSNKITNLANGTTASDAINLGQLNSTISGVIKSGQIEVADWALSGGTYKAVVTYSVAFSSKPKVVITGGDLRSWTVDPGAISFDVDSNSGIVPTLPTYWIATNAGS